MKTLDLCHKLDREVMWKLPKEDWSLIEKTVNRLNDLHYRVLMLENLWKIQRDFHIRNGDTLIVESINSFLNEQYLRGEHEGSS